MIIVRNSVWLMIGILVVYRIPGKPVAYTSRPLSVDYCLQVSTSMILGGDCCETALLASCLCCTDECSGLMSELLLPQL